MIDHKALSELPADAVERMEFTDTLIPMAQLAEMFLRVDRRAGFSGVKFTRCLIRGPAVIVPSGDTRFNRCNLGDAAGDVRNLFLLAVGPMVTGAIPVNGCQFDDCEMHGIGYAGEKPFIDMLVDGLTRNAGSTQ